mmetsp:Transcript_18131/g.13181  ORF Transcript_18131/g.13181 Transcript_18131/m.13181 type:complete len:92 (-) Transcript_18131:92-367(-)
MPFVSSHTIHNIDSMESDMIEASNLKTLPIQDAELQSQNYTMDEVSIHNKIDDAWTVVDGIVYDISRLVKVHPGGFTNIFQAVGKDGSKTF